MITRQVMKNPHNNNSSIHLISDKKTRNGESVSVCTDILKGYEVSRDVVTLLDVDNRAIAGADVLIELDYIDEKAHIRLKTTINGVEDIVEELDEEVLLDSLIECVDYKKVLAKTNGIGVIKDRLSKQLEISLLEEHNKILTSSEPMVAYIEVYNNNNDLIAKANRLQLEANVNSLDVTLCEYLGVDVADSDGEMCTMDCYVGNKKITSSVVSLTDSTTSRSKIRYVSGYTYRSDLVIEEGNIDLYNKALESIKQLNVGVGKETDDLCEYIDNNNLPQKLMAYVRKNKIKFGVEGIDINRYLLEELL